MNMIVDDVKDKQKDNYEYEQGFDVRVVVGVQIVVRRNKGDDVLI